MPAIRQSEKSEAQRYYNLLVSRRPSRALIIILREGIESSSLVAGVSQEPLILYAFPEMICPDPVAIVSARRRMSLYITLLEAGLTLIGSEGGPPKVAEMQRDDLRIELQWGPDYVVLQCPVSKAGADSVRLRFPQRCSALDVLVE